MKVLSLNFIYYEVCNGIFEVLVKEKNHLSHTDLYKKLIENKERKLSSRDFSKILAIMVEENQLTKIDTGKRGTRVYYSLTGHSKEKHELKILGEGERYEKRRQIYHLLLYYDVFKRNNLVTRVQLNKLLKKAGITFDDIDNIENEDRDYVKNYTFLSNSHIENVKLLGCPKGIAIGEHLENKEETKMKKDTQYYVVTPGFTVEEFISYINKLKKNKEPKPFTNNIPLIPYVYYTNYTKDEITESIKLLRKAGFLRLTSPIFDGEMRYIIPDRRLFLLFFMLKIIHIYQFELTIAKIIHIGKPNQEDKDLLMYFFDEQKTDVLIAKAHELRKTFPNDNQNSNKSKIEKAIKELEEQKDVRIVQLKEFYDDILPSNTLLQDLIS